MKYHILGDNVYFWFASNDTSGSGDDGATPVFDVRLAGDSSSAAPVYSGSGTLLSHADYPAGAHEIAIPATTANGFASGSEYAVFCTLLVDSQNPTGFVGDFKLDPVYSDLYKVRSDSQSAIDLKDFADHGYLPDQHKVYDVYNTDELLAAVLTGTGDIQSRIPTTLIGGRMNSDLQAIQEDTQSVTDLKDFIDIGYLPTEHKVYGVHVTDDLVTGVLTGVSNMQGTLSTIAADVENIDGDAMRGTDNAALAATALSTATWTNTRAGYLDNLSAGAVALNSDISTLLSRIVGTLATGTHNAQSGDAYSVVNNVTYGNSAIKTLIDAVATASALATVASNVSTILGRVIGTIASGTHNAQSGDAYSRIGATGSGLTSLAPASTALSSATWTATRAGYLDNLSSGAVALEATLTAMKGVGWTTETLKAIYDAGGGGGGDATAANQLTILANQTTILSRLVGTIAAGTHVAQSGDGYAILSDSTYGNSALKIILNSIAAAVGGDVTITDKNVRICQVTYDDTTYDLAVGVNSLDEINDVIEQWALDQFGIISGGQTVLSPPLDLPSALVYSKTLSDVIITLDLDDKIYEIDV